MRFRTVYDILLGKLRFAIAIKPTTVVDGFIDFCYRTQNNTSCAQNSSLSFLKHKIMLTLSDEQWWTLGVLNVFFSSWLAGAFPHTYWIVHFFKLGYLLIRRLVLWSGPEKKKMFFLCDYCYMTNYGFFLFYTLCLCLSSNGTIAFDNIQYYVFRMLFTSSVGPLAVSVNAFGNSLVFHNPEQITILALHWSPNVAIWGMRWFTNDLEHTFPNVFNIGCGEPHAPTESGFWSGNDVCEGNFVELWVYPLVAYIVLYAIPYGFFFFVCCKDYLEKGNYKTMFEDNKNAPGIKQFLALGGSGFQELKYCIVHALSCSLAFFLGPLLWHSFALHTIYLCLIILGATMRGSAYYNRVFGKIKAKEYLEQKEAEDAANIAAAKGKGEKDLELTSAP